MYCPHKTPQSIQHRLLYTRRLYGCEKAITDKCRNNWRPTRQYVHGTCCSILYVVVTGRTFGAGCPAGNAHWIIQTNWLLCNVRARLCIFYKRQRSIKKQRICDRRQRPTSGAETPVPQVYFSLLRLSIWGIWTRPIYTSSLPELKRKTTVPSLFNRVDGGKKMSE